MAKSKLELLRAEEKKSASVEPAKKEVFKEVAPATKEQIEKQEKKEKATYFCRDMEYSFFVKIIGKDGKPVEKKDYRGDVVYKDGIPVFEEKQYKFQAINSRPDEQLSIFNVTKETPKNVKDVLIELCQSRDNTIMTEEQYDESKNTEAFAERKKNVALKSVVSEQSEEIASLKAKLDTLKG